MLLSTCKNLLALVSFSSILELLRDPILVMSDLDFGKSYRYVCDDISKR